MNTSTTKMENDENATKSQNTPSGTRTHNRLIRSQTPYPLGHGRLLLVGFKIYYKTDIIISASEHIVMLILCLTISTPSNSHE